VGIQRYVKRHPAECQTDRRFHYVFGGYIVELRAFTLLALRRQCVDKLINLCCFFQKGLSFIEGLIFIGVSILI
jgi:hypothetical protein